MFSIKSISLLFTQFCAPLFTTSWHEMWDNLNRAVETKHRSHQCLEDQLQKNRLLWCDTWPMIPPLYKPYQTVARNGFCKTLFLIFWVPNLVILLINVPNKIKMCFVLKEVFFFLWIDTFIPICCPPKCINTKFIYSSTVGI